MLFSLLKHYLVLYISDTALKVFCFLYCFTTSISHCVENYFLRLWSTGISDAFFAFFFLLILNFEVGKSFIAFAPCFLGQKFFLKFLIQNYIFPKVLIKNLFLPKFLMHFFINDYFSKFKIF